MLNLTYRELNYKTNLKYILDFSQTDAQIEPKESPDGKSHLGFLLHPFVGLRTNNHR